MLSCRQGSLFVGGCLIKGIQYFQDRHFLAHVNCLSPGAPMGIEFGEIDLPLGAIQLVLHIGDGADRWCAARMSYFAMYRFWAASMLNAISTVS